LPTPITYTVQSPRKILGADATVRELIDHDTNWWNKTLIEEIFTHEEALVISKLPVSCTLQKDVLIWRGTATGEFSVRSAYHLAKELQDAMSGESSMSSSVSEIWRIMWQLQIPNAVKMFLWKACHNLLPTKDNLLKRGVVQESLCPICGLETESITHILWSCSSAMDVWSVCGKTFQKSHFCGSDFLQLVEEMFNKCDREEFGFFVRIARQIWFRRNSVVHGEDFLHPNLLVKGTMESSEEYKQANLGDSALPKSVGVQAKWQAPPTGTYKVNWDAAVDSVNGRMGIGIVVRDYEGHVIAARSVTIMGNLEPIAAEALAAFQATNFSKDLGLQHIILEGDALQVVKAVNCPSRNWSRFGQLVEDTRMVIHSFSSWRVSHISRVANSAAHGLAKAAVKHIIDQVWMEEIPICICDVVLLEQSALFS
jgi:ribonuclease HI